MSDETRSIYRILDASANRAAEGLRCLEEYARFAVDDPATTEGIKELRHDLTMTLQRIDRRLLLASRDTEGDVGTKITHPAERNRSQLADVVAAAVARIGQSLRVLEEYGKLIDSRFASAIEQIRYRSYTHFATLEQGILLDRESTGVRRERLSRSQLYVLIDGGENETEFVRHVRRLFESGVDILQLRDHRADDRTLISRARLGTEIAHRLSTLFIVNDRADLAVAADADGVHVGQDELPAPIARQIVGPDRLVGVSTHSIEQAKQAVLEEADYIGCGPVFPGRTKDFESYVGPGLLREVCEAIEIPAFAIGGIDLDNVRQVVDAGFSRVAVTGVIRDAENPDTAATRLREILGPPTDRVNADRLPATDRSAGRSR